MPAAEGQLQLPSRSSRPPGGRPKPLPLHLVTTALVGTHTCTYRGNIHNAGDGFWIFVPSLETLDEKTDIDLH